MCLVGKVGLRCFVLKMDRAKYIIWGGDLRCFEKKWVSSISLYLTRSLSLLSFGLGPPPQAIATQCAEAIAVLQFEQVAYLRDLPSPNRVQMAFIHIIAILSEVKKYVPEAVLQRLAGAEVH